MALIPSIRGLVFESRYIIMFILTKLKSLVKIEPRDLNRSLPEALSDTLNAKLSNKVVKGEN